MTTPRPDREGIDAKELLAELAWSARHCKLGRLHVSREEALAIVAEDERLRARLSQAATIVENERALANEAQKDKTNRRYWQGESDACAVILNKFAAAGLLPTPQPAEDD